jgi:UDPglucose 6-dehydrogenase
MRNRGHRMNVTVIGSGYVGLVTGVCLAEVGHSVWLVDKDKSKIESLKSHKTPFYEPGLEKIIARNLEHERLTFSTDLTSSIQQSDIAFIAVGTPEQEDGSADLSHVLSAAQELGQVIEKDLVVIVKSTVPVGTCDRVEAAIQESLRARKKLLKVPVASNPEFLQEGVAIAKFMTPDRIIVGLLEPSLEPLFRDLYRPFIIDDPGKLILMGRRSAELTKYGANSMLATRISFMNELANLCEQVGADIDDVRLGMGSDPRIGRKFLYAGPGYGGSCFPKDVAALLHTSQQFDLDLKLVRATDEVNQAQKRSMGKRVKQVYGDLNGKTLAVWGLAFKPGTDDVRESPAAAMIEFVTKHGAKVVAHDPQGAENFCKLYGHLKSNMSLAKSAYQALDNADGLILVTEWTEYRRPNWEKVASLMREKIVFDFRNQYRFETMKKNGFKYYCVGRPDSGTKLDS